MAQASDCVVVLCTVGGRDEADRIASLVVERELAACANIVPGLISVYRWKGQVQRDEELLLVMKSRRERFEELRAAIAAVHTYEVPEIVALPLVAGHEPYVRWILESVSPGSSR